MTATILILPGDGIGPEIVREAERVLLAVRDRFGLDLDTRHGRLGGAAVDADGDPFPAETERLAHSATAVLLGAIGGPKWETIERAKRPERGILRLRSSLGLFANLRPARLYRQLSEASTLRADVIAGLDLMMVRELTGGIYFGEPRGMREVDGLREGYNTLVYREDEIARIAHVAFEIARQRNRRVCSVDKANVLEATELWREVVTEVHGGYADVELRHMYVDNAAMQLVRDPRQFDVLLTTNLFGDILSDLASMSTGSIGMLPSAALNESRRGLYEPIHGSAPDIAGQDLANPLATILSVGMMFRHTLDRPDCADAIEAAVNAVLDAGLRTADIHTAGCERVGTQAMGDAVVAAIEGG